MELNDKTNLLVQNYVRRQYPECEEGVSRFIVDKVQCIELSTTSLANASIQVSNNPPISLFEAMLRYAVSPWDPVGNSFSGLLVYTGNALVQI